MYDLIIRAVQEQPWAILPSYMVIITDLLAMRAEGHRLTEEEIQARIGAASPRPASRSAGAVAVIPVFGVINQRMNMLSQMSGGTSTEKLGRDIRDAVNNPEVGSIALDIDSPGGGVFGVQELAGDMRAAREQKPIVAVANSMAASAAYWIAASASEIVVTPSGEVGSIGVFAAHRDVSAAMEMEGRKTTLISAGKYKVEGNPFEALGDEARDAIQARVDEYYDAFVSAVAKGRGVSVPEVRKGFGEGRMMSARAALSQGMVDRIDTLENTISRLARQGGKGTPGNRRAELSRNVARASLG